jgi:hypothetical protein
MEFLRSTFHDDLSASVAPDGTISIGAASLTPLSVLQSDPAAYNESFRDWIDAWIDERMATAGVIIAASIPQNGQRLDGLSKVVLLGQAIPFVGAGMSCPSGLPGWAAFLRQLCPLSNLDPVDLETYLTAGEYENAADALLNSMPIQLFNERYEAAFRLPTANGILGAVRLLPEVFKSHAVSTNFDPIVESVYSIQSIPFDHVLYGPDVQSHVLLHQDGQRCLLKPHGDHLRTYTRVLTIAEYDKFYAAREPTREAIEHIYRANNIVFMGCGLSNDRTMKVFKETADNSQNLPRHYAFLKLPADPKEQLSREHFLTQRGIFPIWYPGDHDESIEALLVYVARKAGVI